MENILDKIRMKDAVDSLRSTVREKSDTLQKTISDTYADVKETVGDAADNAKAGVSKNPWRALGIAAAVSLLVGIAVGSRLGRSKR